MSEPVSQLNRPTKGAGARIPLEGSTAPLSKGYINDEDNDGLYSNLLASVHQTSNLGKSEVYSRSRSQDRPRYSKGREGTVTIGTSLFDKRIEGLAIYSTLPRIVQTVEESTRPVAVTADTGSGKSLGVIAALYKANRNHSSFRVFIAVPTRTAAYNLYNQLSAIIGIKGIVGYQADRHSEMQDNTQIIYVTYGRFKSVLLNYITRIRPLDDQSIPSLMSHVILDEIHQLSIDAIMVMASLGHLQKKFPSIMPKVILLSATLPTNGNIEGYLGDVIPIEFKIERNYPLTIEYHNRSFGTARESISREQEHELYRETAMVVKSFHEKLKNNHPFIVFAAGQKEITIIAELIRGYKLSKVIVMEITGSIDQDQISKIYDPTEARKIIVTTNVVESSVTINNVTLVVDTLREKVIVNDTIYRNDNAGIDDIQRLRPTWIDQQSATQRGGRAGRTVPGTCYRMCTQSFFNSLPVEKESELNRVSLYNPILNFLAAGIDPHELLIQNQSIDNYQQSLTHIGLIDNTPTVTPSGLFAARMPLGVRNSRLIWEWINSFPTDGYNAIVVANLIEYGASVFRIPPQAGKQSADRYHQMVAEHINKFYTKYRAPDDVMVMINVWADYQKTGKNNPHQYCKTNQLRFRQFIEITENIKGCIKIITSLTPDQRSRFNLPRDVTVTDRSLNREIVHTRGVFFLGGSDRSDDPAVTAASVDRRSYADQVMIRGNGNNYRLTGDRMTYRLNDRGAVSTMINVLPPGIIALDKYSIEVENGSLRVVNFAIVAPIQARTPEPTINDLLTFNSEAIDHPIDIQRPLTYREVAVSAPLEIDLNSIFNYNRRVYSFRVSLPEEHRRGFDELILTIRASASEDELYPPIDESLWPIIAASSLPPEFQTEWGSILAEHQSNVIANEYPYILTNITRYDQYNQTRIEFTHNNGTDYIILPPGFADAVGNRLDPSLSEATIVNYIAYLGLLYDTIIRIDDELFINYRYLLPLAHLGFTVLDTPLITNDYFPLGLGSHGLFPQFEQSIVPEVNAPTIVILPRTLIAQYLATINPDYPYLFIYRDRDGEYYSSLPVIHHSDSYTTMDHHRIANGSTEGITYALANGNDELAASIVAALS